MAIIAAQTVQLQVARIAMENQTQANREHRKHKIKPPNRLIIR